MFKPSPYLDSFKQILTQFDFLRFALSSLSKNKNEEFFRMQRQKDIVTIDKRGQELSNLGVDEGLIQLYREGGRQVAFKKWSRESRNLYRAQYVPDDLNKSELLLLVALFERHLKDFYRELTTVEPRRAFAKSGKLESLKLIFAKNDVNWARDFFQRIVDEESERFDHLPFKDRMKFLEVSFDIRVGAKQIELADSLINLRHRISHRWTDRSQVKHVGLQDLEDARRVFRVIAVELSEQAMKKYPKHFVH